MPQSLANILVHITFSTKERRPFLDDAALRDELYREVAIISRSIKCPVIRVGGTSDHIHILGLQARTISLADWIKEMKRVSSIWIKTKSPALKTFQWQSGYGAFSVSQSLAPTVDRYIARQEIHHRKMSFQDEFRTLLRKHGVEFDEQYVWD